MEFDEPVQRLRTLLATSGWPTDIIWVATEHVAHFSTRAVFIFRSHDAPPAEEHARKIFAERYGVAPAISFHAIGHLEGITFATVEPIDELGQGEQMFIADGLKISHLSEPPPIHLTSSRLEWWFVKRWYHKWARRRDRALATA